MIRNHMVRLLKGRTPGRIQAVRGWSPPPDGFGNLFLDIDNATQVRSCP